MGCTFTLDLATMGVRQACFTIATLSCRTPAIYAADHGGAVAGEWRGGWLVRLLNCPF